VLRFNSRDIVDGSRSTAAAICRIERPARYSSAIAQRSSSVSWSYLLPIATPPGGSVALRLRIQGIHLADAALVEEWIPAFAGMTDKVR
jgi:hypothetical protein